MTYFKIRRADRSWLITEIDKGTLFYKYSFPSLEWVPCGYYWKGNTYYDRLSAREVTMMINKDKNVYWRN